MGEDIKRSETVFHFNSKKDTMLILLASQANKIFCMFYELDEYRRTLYKYEARTEVPCKEIAKELNNELLHWEILADLSKETSYDNENIVDMKFDTLEDKQTIALIVGYKKIWGTIEAIKEHIKYLLDKPEGSSVNPIEESEIICELLKSWYELELLA